MKKQTFVVVLVLGLVFMIITNAFAGVAGSSEDPLVSKSYVDKKIQEILASMSTSVSQKGGSSVNVVTTTSTFTPVEVKAGKILVGKEGTEIIFRTGKCVAHTSGENGIYDVSAGADILNSQEVPNNHFLIIPRDDGRGLVCLYDSWFMVKGDYDIK